MHLTSLIFSASLIASTWATSTNVRTKHDKCLVGNPKLKSATLKGTAIEPTLNRDGCGSTAWGDRILWVCRDTQPVFPNGTTNKPAVWDGSASYSNMTHEGPAFIPIPPDGQVEDNAGYTHELLLYGNNHESPFYVLSDEFCGNNSAGLCPNGLRYPRSPDSPPLVTSYDEGTGMITAYTWIKNKLHDNNTNVIINPSTALYKVTWSPMVEGADSAVLPKTAFVSPTFFQENEFAYGAAGNIIVNDTAYLWAQSFLGAATSLARVPLSGIEDLSRYEYYVSGAWTSHMPSSVNVTEATINCTAGGQGTFYYSPAWSSYVWIGGVGQEINGEFFVSTSPAPEGPWTTPEHFLTVPLGNYTEIPAYGFQAHPDLVVDENSNDMYISYTKKMTTGYQTPLYLLEWEHCLDVVNT
ncbi:uncharacterized protein PFLUO_LOCUS383 [Penicillium psychrofluorescens]|uniref:uncharacterized protein n=1 Tax=Penicillium psychrofluorescens TaxID=3158075 RepID=UPI003CCE0512